MNQWVLFLWFDITLSKSGIMLSNNKQYSFVCSEIRSRQILSGLTFPGFIVPFRSFVDALTFLFLQCWRMFYCYQQLCVMSTMILILSYVTLPNTNILFNAKTSKNLSISAISTSLLFIIREHSTSHVRRYFQQVIQCSFGLLMQHFGPEICSVWCGSREKSGKIFDFFVSQIWRSGP